MKAAKVIASKMRSMGYLNATTSDAAKLILGRRYLVANRKCTKVEAAYCNETVENERRIRLYHECQTRNHWPGFSASWVTVDMKEWDLKKYQP